MGYTSYVSGSLTIVPRLSDAQIKDLGLDPHEDGGELMAESGGEDDTVALINGEITVVPGKSFTLITTRYDERHKAYGLPEEFDTVVTTVVAAGHDVKGAFYVEGEEFPDLTRFRVENGAAIVERPEFLWPNGDKGWG